MRLSSVELPAALPTDLQRIIFEYAAEEDNRTALTLVLVARYVQRWIDRILYRSISLHRQCTSRNFLRTIDTSPTKTASFFEEHVKALCISFDIFNDRTVKIVRACKGVAYLTFWSVPGASQARSQAPAAAPSTFNFLNTAYHQGPHSSPHAMLTVALNALRPRRLSVLLHDILRAPNQHLGTHHIISGPPQFHLPLFQNLTHLTIINAWQDWCTWSWSALSYTDAGCLKTRARLTHLSLDLRVGATPLSPLQAGIIASGVRAVLGDCSHLQVLVLLAIFDMRPWETADAIMGAMRMNALAGTVAADPRLVFFRDSEPFRDREAHSGREDEIWKFAETMVSEQAERGIRESRTFAAPLYYWSRTTTKRKFLSARVS